MRFRLRKRWWLLISTVAVTALMAGTYVLVVKPFDKVGYYRDSRRPGFVICKDGGDEIQVYVSLHGNAPRQSTMELNPVEPEGDESRYLGWLPGSAVYVSVTSSTIRFFTDPDFADETVCYEKIYNPLQVLSLSGRKR